MPTVSTAPPAGGLNYTPVHAAAVERVRRARGNPYKILDVADRTTDHAVLKTAKRKGALSLHPDKNCHPGAAEAMKQFNEAFEKLIALPLGTFWVSPDAPAPAPAPPAPPPAQPKPAYTYPRPAQAQPKPAPSSAYDKYRTQYQHQQQHQTPQQRQRQQQQQRQQQKTYEQAFPDNPYKSYHAKYGGGGGGAAAGTGAGAGASRAQRDFFNGAGQAGAQQQRGGPSSGPGFRQYAYEPDLDDEDDIEVTGFRRGAKSSQNNAQPACDHCHRRSVYGIWPHPILSHLRLCRDCNTLNRFETIAKDDAMLQFGLTEEDLRLYADNLPQDKKPVAGWKRNAHTITGHPLVRIYLREHVEKIVRVKAEKKRAEQQQREKRERSRPADRSSASSAWAPPADAPPPTARELERERLKREAEARAALFERSRLAEERRRMEAEAEMADRIRRETEARQQQEQQRRSATPGAADPDPDSEDEWPRVSRAQSARAKEEEEDEQEEESRYQSGPSAGPSRAERAQTRAKEAWREVDDAIEAELLAQRRAQAGAAAGAGSADATKAKPDVAAAERARAAERRKMDATQRQQASMAKLREELEAQRAERAAAAAAEEEEAGAGGQEEEVYYGQPMPSTSSSSTPFAHRKFANLPSRGHYRNPIEVSDDSDDDVMCPTAADANDSTERARSVSESLADENEVRMNGSGAAAADGTSSSASSTPTATQTRMPGGVDPRLFANGFTALQPEKAGRSPAYVTISDSEEEFTFLRHTRRSSGERLPKEGGGVAGEQRDRAASMDTETKTEEGEEDELSETEGEDDFEVTEVLYSEVPGSRVAKEEGATSPQSAKVETQRDINIASQRPDANTSAPALSSFSPRPIKPLRQTTPKVNRTQEAVPRSEDTPAARDSAAQAPQTPSSAKPTDAKNAPSVGFSTGKKLRADRGASSSSSETTTRRRTRTRQPASASARRAMAAAAAAAAASAAAARPPSATPEPQAHRHRAAGSATPAPAETSTPTATGTPTGRTPKVHALRREKVKMEKKKAVDGALAAAAAAQAEAEAGRLRSQVGREGEAVGGGWPSAEVEHAGSSAPSAVPQTDSNATSQQDGVKPKPASTPKKVRFNPGASSPASLRTPRGDGSRRTTRSQTRQQRQATASPLSAPATPTPAPKLGSATSHLYSATSSDSGPQQPAAAASLPHRIPATASAAYEEELPFRSLHISPLLSAATTTPVRPGPGPGPGPGTDPLGEELAQGLRIDPVPPIFRARVAGGAGRRGGGASRIGGGSGRPRFGSTTTTPQQQQPPSSWTGSQQHLADIAAQARSLWTSLGPPPSQSFPPQPQQPTSFHLGASPSPSQAAHPPPPPSTPFKPQHPVVDAPPFSPLSGAQQRRFGWGWPHPPPPPSASTTTPMSMPMPSAAVRAAFVEDEDVEMTDA